MRTPKVRVEDGATVDARGRPWGWHGSGLLGPRVGDGEPQSLPTAHGRVLASHHDLLALGNFRVVYRNSDALIL